MGDINLVTNKFKKYGLGFRCVLKIHIFLVLKLKFKEKRDVGMIQLLMVFKYIVKILILGKKKKVTIWGGRGWGKW